MNEAKDKVGRKERNLPKFKFKRFLLTSKDEYTKTEEDI